jgi:cobalt-zinc-cadmium efflux system protein
MCLENNKCIYGEHSHKPIEKEHAHHEHAHHEHSHEHSHHHEHSHEHSHEHDFRSVDKRVLKIGFIITLSAMFAEVIAGILSGSLALISDAIHMFTHAFALSISLLAIIIATTKYSKEKTFGYHRIEVIAALINGLTIALSVAWIVYEAIQRFINPHEIDIKMMLIVATFGLVVNIITGTILYQGDRENINIKSAFFHMLADVASSVVIIIGGIVVYFTNFYIVDTILALFVACVIGRWAYLLLKDSINILLESSPIDVDKVKKFVESNNKIINIHDIHIIEITHNMYVLSAHVLISKENFENFKSLADNINNQLLEKFNISHITLQPEYI